MEEGWHVYHWLDRRSQWRGLGIQGGNVSAYFCTPSMEVLGFVPGNVTAGVFLREARRAEELAYAVEKMPGIIA